MISITAYNEPKSKLNQNEIEQLLRHVPKAILAGDFNAKNNLWNCTKYNTNRHILEKICEESLGYKPLRYIYLLSTSSRQATIYHRHCHYKKCQRIQTSNSKRIIIRSHSRYILNNRSRAL